MTYALLIVETAVSREKLPTAWHTFLENEKPLPGHTMLTKGSHLFQLPTTLPALGVLLDALDRFQYPYSIAMFEEKPDFHQR